MHKKMLFLTLPARPWLVLLFLLLFSFAGKESRTQSLGKDSIHVDKATDSIYKFYTNAVGGAISIYNGAEYTGSYPLTTGTPFFNTDDFEKGLICYDGVLYPDILMAYDLVTGEIVVKGYQQLSIKLNPVKVDYFLLRGHFFINGGNDNGSAESSPGFYEILYNGAVKLYARRWKQVERATNAADPYVFKSYNYYFIEKEKKYHGIEGKRDFLKLFADRQQALKSFWKNKKLDFKKSKEQSIIQTVAFLCS